MTSKTNINNTAEEMISVEAVNKIVKDTLDYAEKYMVDNFYEDDITAITARCIIRGSEMLIRHKIDDAIAAN